MGAIQNSINQSIGAVMDGAIAMEHLSEKIDTKTKEAANLTAQHQEETNKLNKAYDEVDKKVDNVQLEADHRAEDYDKAKENLKTFAAEKNSKFAAGTTNKEGQNIGGRFMSKEDKKKEIIKRRHDLKKMQTAMNETTKQLTALQTQRDEIKNYIDAVNARVSVAEKQLKHYGYKAPTAVSQTEVR